MISFMSPFQAQRVNDYVVAYLPIVQIFLRLERVHVYLDVLGFHYTFSCSILGIPIHASLQSWRLQLSNTAKKHSITK